MLSDENKAIVRRFYEGYKAGEIEGTFELVAPDLVHHGLSGRTFTRESWKQAEVEIFVAFPDSSTTIEFQIAEGDKVCTRWLLHGSHRGVFMGFPPTGKPVALSIITIDRVADGILEHWVEADMMGFMRQLAAKG